MDTWRSWEERHAEGPLRPQLRPSRDPVQAREETTPRTKPHGRQHRAQGLRVRPLSVGAGVSPTARAEIRLKASDCFQVT